MNPTFTPILLLASPLKGEELNSLPFKGRVGVNQRLGCGLLQPSRMASCFIQGMGKLCIVPTIPVWEYLSGAGTKVSRSGRSAPRTAGAAQLRSHAERGNDSLKE